MPSTPEGRRGLAAIVTDPAGALLAVDFDGTLAPIVERPEDARIHPDAHRALCRLASRIGTLAVITGRPAAAAAEYADLSALEGSVVVLGGYGRERWDPAGGVVVAPPAPRAVDAARAELPAVVAAAPPGTFLEDKGAALAVHVRRAEDPHAAFAAIRAPVLEIAGRYGLAVEPGRLVLELRPPGIDKGAALRSLVAERAARSVAFVGDDLGDRPAFAVVAALRDEGVPGLTVCSTSAEAPDLATRADLVVEAPPGVAAFLDALATAIDCA